MINLKLFFRNHLDTKYVSDDHMKEFTEVHLLRLTANNPGSIYSPLITDTTTVYTAYFGAISNEDLKFSLQQGLTITMQNTMKDFIKMVQKKQGIIQGTWGKGSAEYQEFLPHGLLEYDHATLANIELLMNRMVGASTAHSADLPAGFVTLFSDLRDAYTDARTAQVTVMGQVSGMKTTSETTRNDLEVQLMKNILIIASNNIGHPERVSTYFNQSIIRRHHAHVPTVNVFDNAIIMGQVVNIEVDGILDHPDGFHLKFENPGPVSYRVYASNNPSGELGSASFFDVNPGDVIDKTGTELIAMIGLNATTDLMNIKNFGPGTGYYKITITE